TEFKGGPKNKDFYKLNIYHTLDEKNNNVLGVKKSQVSIKDYLWFLNEEDAADNRIVFDKNLKNFSIENILMTHDNQKIQLEGFVRDSTYKDIKLSFQDVSLGKLLPAMDSLRVEGNLNGKIHFKQNKNIYQPSSSIKIDSLHVNEVSLGNLGVEIEGNEALNRFSVKSALENENIENFIAAGDIGIINKQTIFDLNFKFNRFNLAALSPLGKNVISKIRGFATGSAGFSGTLKKPQVEGRLFLDEVGLKVPYLNVDYEFERRSVIDLTENQFRFNDAKMVDTKYGTTGYLSGSIKHQNFKNWILDLNIASERMLVLDTKDSDDAIYYGTAFIQGTASIKGPTNGLLIAVNAESKKGTSIKIPISSASGVGSNSFIKFLSPKEKYNLANGITENIVKNSGLELQFDLKITPEAEVEIIIDRNTGHGLKGRGNGTMRLEISTLGKFNMLGVYEVAEGIYNFKYGGIIDKKFQVKKGSTISWDGDPIRARLNIDAVYKTQANPAVLQDNASLNRKVPVEVVIGLTGNLTNPEPDFTINFPTVSSVLKSELQVKLDDKDTRVNQALSLLGTGNFLSAENAGTAVYGSLFERASGLFNDLFQDKDGKFNVVIDYQAGDRTPTAETSGQVGIAITTQINDRISIDGKVGVPVGGVNQSVIVGNVEVKYRVNDDGTLNLRVFNRENDINYFGEGIGYTQGLGVSYEVDFDTLRELWFKIFNIKMLEKDKNAPDEIPDSDFTPDFIQWTQERRKKADSPKSEQQKVPETE
ncbi:MAG TPA: translocation/assembly module TamB domain-containing protein, partial [Flavobacterium sp.]|nr:translocation/assembly module TamB domain-containing protein [Flavobacterium sp.]